MWFRSGSNYCKIVSKYNCRGMSLVPSRGINNKWKINVSFARMNDAHILAEMIKIRDVVTCTVCCILSKDDVSDIIEHLTVL